MIIEELTMPAFIEGLTKTRTIIVPFGVVEEHGQHLLLGTDTIHAYELSSETVQKHEGQISNFYFPISTISERLPS